MKECLHLSTHKIKALIGIMKIDDKYRCEKIMSFTFHY